MNKILRMISFFLMKIKITIQSIKYYNKKNDNAVEFLNKKNSNCEMSCIREKEDSKTLNYQLSIIIPAYNCEKYLEKCINSVLFQKLKYTYEIIIVNDGSTDDTKKVLDQYRNINNIHIIEQ